jgi:hypothetical protein
MAELQFNGKKVRKGKAKSFRPEETTHNYALLGASPPVQVHETVWPNGKRAFYVESRFSSKGVRTMKPSKRRGRLKRKTIRLYDRNSYSGHGDTLSAALKQLEKRMKSAFKQLAEALDYTVEG